MILLTCVGIGMIIVGTINMYVFANLPSYRYEGKHRRRPQHAAVAVAAPVSHADATTVKLWPFNLWSQS